MDMNKKRKLAKRYFKILNFEEKESPSGYYLNFNSLNVEEFLRGGRVQKIQPQENSLIFLDDTLSTNERLIKVKEKEFGFDFRKNKFEAFNLAFYKNGISAKINKDLKIIFISKTSQIIRNFFFIKNANVKIVEFYTGKGFSSVSNRFLIKNSIVEHQMISNNSSNSFVQDSFKLESSKFIQRSFIKAKKGFNLKAFTFDVLESEVKQKLSVINSGSQLWISSLGKVFGKSNVEVSSRGLLLGSSTFFENLLECDKNSKSSSINTDIRVMKEKNAKVFCIPSLSVNNKNCSARHSFSMIELDKDEIKYLKAKGIDTKSVKKIIKENILRWWRS
jgi:Fe-S cluster assembly scaffold protein SufB